MRYRSPTAFALLGAALIAIAYGLARFAFGLFVPPIRDELGISQEVMGVVGAQPFISFVLASVAASWLAERLGARGAAVLSAAFALLGLTLISRADSALTLGAGVFACGLCTGTMMPALSTGVQVAIRPALHGRVNAVMNAGTSAGVALGVPAVLLLAGAWREAYAAFAVATGVAMVAAWRYLPAAAAATVHTPATGVLRRALSGRMIVLCLFALAMGWVSSAYWVFAPDLVVQLGGMPPHLTGLLWLTVGLVGLTAAFAADWGDRFGMARVQAAALLGMAVALLALVVAPDRLSLALASAALFGLVYMTLTGLYLVVGIRLSVDRPSLGAVLPFTAIAVGQALGSPMAGSLAGYAGYGAAFTTFAAVGVAAAACLRLFPVPPRPEPTVYHAGTVTQPADGQPSEGSG
ncbi:MAG: MFS transporter [Halorhodospira sp.]